MAKNIYIFKPGKGKYGVGATPVTLDDLYSLTGEQGVVSNITSTSQLINNGEDGLNPFITNNDIPTGLSSFSNDTNFITADQVPIPTLNQVLYAGNISDRNILLLADNPGNFSITNIFPGFLQVYNNSEGVFIGGINPGDKGIGFRTANGGIYQTYLDNDYATTNGQRFHFPNKPGGHYTLATTSDIPADGVYFPYTGATSNVDANQVEFSNIENLYVNSDGVFGGSIQAANLSGTNTGDQDLSPYQLMSQKGVSNGYAGLDINGKVPLSQMNDAVLGNVQYQGLYNASTNSPSLTIVKPKGNYYIVSTAGTQFGKSYEIGDWIISNGVTWDKVDNTDAVSSVVGETGNVSAASIYSALYGDGLLDSYVTYGNDIGQDLYWGGMSMYDIDQVWLNRLNLYDSAIADSGFIYQFDNTINFYGDQPGDSYFSFDYLSGSLKLFSKDSGLSVTIQGANNLLFDTTLDVPVVNGTIALLTSTISSTEFYKSPSGSTIFNALALKGNLSGNNTWVAGLNDFQGSVRLNAQAASSIVATASDKNLVTLNTAIYPSLAELAYVKGVTSAIQTQLNAKADDSGVVHLTGTETIAGAKTFSSVALMSNGMNVGNNFSIANITSSRGTLNFGSATAPMYAQRNTADAVAAFRALNSNATSTGDIMEFVAISTLVGGVRKDGRFYGSVGTASNDFVTKAQLDGLLSSAQLTGLSLGTRAIPQATDNVLSAIGKLSEFMQSMTATRFITANHTALSTDYLIDCTFSPTVTLPAVAFGVQKQFVIKNSGTGTVTINVTGGGTIDGLTSQTLTTQWSCMTVHSDGFNYKIINKF